MKRAPEEEKKKIGKNIREYLGDPKDWGKAEFEALRHIKREVPEDIWKKIPARKVLYSTNRLHFSVCGYCIELNVDNWNDNCEAKSEAKSPRPLRGLQADFSLTRNVSYAVR